MFYLVISILCLYFGNYYFYFLDLFKNDTFILEFKIKNYLFFKVNVHLSMKFYYKYSKFMWCFFVLVFAISFPFFPSRFSISISHRTDRETDFEDSIVCLRWLIVCNHSGSLFILRRRPIESSRSVS